MISLLAILVVGSGQLAEGPSSERAEVSTWALSSEPELSIGVLAGDPEYELHRVQAALRLSDGSLAIANGGSWELRFYDRSGGHLRSAGRQGEGPGEFQQILSAQRIRGDTVAVWDNLQRRITYFAPDGNRGRDFRLELTGEEISLNSLTAPAIPWTVSFRSDGTFMVTPLFPLWLLTGLRMKDDGYGGVNQDAVAADGIRSFRHPVYIFDADGRHIATSDRLDSFELVMFEGSVQPRRFGRSFQAAAAGSRFWTSNGRSGELISIQMDGATRVVRTRITARAVTMKLFDDEIASSLQNLAPSARTKVARLHRSVPVPDSLPTFAALLVDDQERIWVEEYLTAPERESAETVRWHVLSREGELLAQVDVPAGLQVSDVSFGYVTGYVSDEYDIERVDSYRIEGSGGAF